MADEKLLKAVSDQVNGIAEATKTLAIESAKQSVVVGEIGEKLDEHISLTRSQEITLTKHSTYWAVVKWLLGGGAGISGIAFIIKLFG
jgi:hypothetical protein